MRPFEPSMSEKIVRLCYNWYLSEESSVGPEGNRQLDGCSKLSFSSVPDSSHPADPEHTHSLPVCKRPCRGAIAYLNSE